MNALFQLQKRGAVIVDQTMKCGAIGNHVPAKDSAASIVLRL